MIESLEKEFIKNLRERVNDLLNLILYFPLLPRATVQIAIVKHVECEWIVNIIEPMI